MKNVPVFLFFIGVSLLPLDAAPVMRLDLKPSHALPGLPVKFEITVESSDGEATSIPNRVALLVAKSVRSSWAGQTPDGLCWYPLRSARV